MGKLTTWNANLLDAVFGYRWPSRRAEWEKMLAADPQVNPPKPMSSSKGEVIELCGIDRELLENSWREEIPK